MLFGGSGADQGLSGDSGADSLLFGDSGGDVLRSNADDYALGTASEVMIERVNINAEAGNAKMVGNENDDLLIGNSLANTLLGGSGAGRLNSRGGSNTMVGGSGDDTFIVTTTAAQVREFVSQGTDLVRAEVDFTLPDSGSTFFIDDLRMQGGFGNIKGTGNSLDSSIQGNTGDNRLAGNQGEDTIEGRGGDDTLFGGAGGDLFYGGGGADSIDLGLDDMAFGGGGEDWFVIGAVLGGAVLGDFDGVNLNSANGEDKLVFDSGLGVGSFSYIDAAAFSGAGNSQARYAGGDTLEVDQNGDGNGDVTLLMSGLSAANQMTTTDFLWL